MAAKAEPIGPRNGHELAPLTTRADGSERPHGVTIVLQGSRGSLQRDAPEEDRAAWSGKLQFFLSIIGYSGIPLFLIEMAIGQKMRLGSLGVWNTIHPWLGGIGISSCIVTLFVALYYNVLIQRHGNKGLSKLGSVFTIKEANLLANEAAKFPRD
ncbi:Transporter [Operophtera brumata]|uniref:Transporter n=1 Tax=Operophtera brumata TaxID=104452 RepID=A0A0L7L2Q1_OPEBR|nr:Transporter [Operophtera brumata]